MRKVTMNVVGATILKDYVRSSRGPQEELTMMVELPRTIETAIGKKKTLAEFCKLSPVMEYDKWERKLTALKKLKPITFLAEEAEWLFLKRIATTENGAPREYVGFFAETTLDMIQALEGAEKVIPSLKATG